MADSSRIEWTDATWNPITGCSLVSEGCRNCYAMRLAAGRLRNHPSRKGLTDGRGKWNGEVRFNEDWLDQPRRWTRPRRIFVVAHGDLFHEAVPDGWIMRVFDVMFHSHNHVFQVLTKRPARMRDFLRKWGDLTGEDPGDPKLVHGPEETRAAHPSGRGQLFADMLEAMGEPPPGAAYPTFDWGGGMIGWPAVPRNVWLGVSVEDQHTAEERLPILADTPAAVRWISAEPLLGPLDLSPWLGLRQRSARPFGIPRPVFHWAVVGGESGPGARRMDPAWAVALRDQCATERVRFFFKQMARKQPIPPELMVREYPRVFGYP